MKKFKIWKTITIGKKPSSEGINISSNAQSMLDKIKWDKNETLDLVRIKVKDLKIEEDYPTTKQIYAKVKKLGLSFCPPQVGLPLRVDYKDQPLNEWLFVGMKPIFDSDGNPGVFFVERDDDGLWLYDFWAFPGNQWRPDGQFVFSLRKSLKPLKSSLKLKSLDTLTFKSLGKRIKILERKIEKIKKI